MIDELVKGDSIDLNCDMGEDIAGWAIRCEIWDSVDGVIEKGSALAGGSDAQIEITDETNGLFTIHVNAGETTNFSDYANIEVEVEVNGKKFTVLKDALSFQTKRIDWTVPNPYPGS